MRPGSPSIRRASAPTRDEGGVSSRGKGANTLSKIGRLLPHAASPTHFPVIPVAAPFPGCARIRGKERRFSHGIRRRGESKDGNFSLLPRLNHAPPRICRTPRNRGIRYRARDAGKSFLASSVGIDTKGEEVFMESGDGVRMKTAISSFSGGFNPPPVRLRANALTSPTPPQGGSVSLCCSGLITARRGVALMVSGVTRKTKIIQFPENIDKFTVFFDKYLKSRRDDMK